MFAPPSRRSGRIRSAKSMGASAAVPGVVAAHKPSAALSTRHLRMPVQRPVTAVPGLAILTTVLPMPRVRIATRAEQRQCRPSTALRPQRERILASSREENRMARLPLPAKVVVVEKSRAIWDRSDRLSLPYNRGALPARLPRWLYRPARGCNGSRACARNPDSPVPPEFGSLRPALRDRPGACNRFGRHVVLRRRKSHVPGLRKRGDHADGQFFPRQG